MNAIIKGNIINPVDRLKTEYIENGGLVINAEKIADILTFNDAIKKYPNYTIIDCSGKYISPGFIDNHLHIPQVNQRARYGENLMDWLNKYIFKAEESFADEEIAEREIRACINALITCGTTTAVMYSTHHYNATNLAFKLAEKAGIKAFIGKVMMDFSLTGGKVESTGQALQESYDLYKKWNHRDNGRLQYIFSPRFAPACSLTLLTELGKIAKSEDIYIQTHLSETKEEIEQTLELFFNFKNYTEVYHKTGILSKKTILGHCIHISDEEFKIIKDTGSKIAHCPSSNFFLKSGRFDLQKAERNGIEIGLGSDVGAGPSFSMFDVMKSMNYIQPYHIFPQKTYYYATLGNTKLLGIDKTTGNFEKGKDADFIIINANRSYGNFTFENIPDLLAYLIYLGHPGFIEDMYIRGKKINLL